MEGAVVNTLRAGDKVITVNGGKFGERWGKIARAYGLEVDEIQVTWGEAVSPAIIEEKLNSDPSIKSGSDAGERNLYRALSIPPTRSRPLPRKETTYC